ncbi:pentapeptide repeat-containing protein [Streptosporangium roseum]|uniref:pentapeptide repeat-containing protein n=1 Tax=Streptosporangium roseum TaxID=2001 RepID=UPI0031E581DB
MPLALPEPRPAAWWIVPAALLVGGTVTAVAWWLLGSLPALPKTAEEVTARQGALQIALGAGAGIGAAITVMLAFRRQRHQELTALITSRHADRTAELADRVAEHNRQDAIERRITELYTKAVEQLGSDKAAVRLGGLYALERLAQDNPGHRQTVVNVICAYLRMPYAPPPAPDLAADRAEALRAARRRHHALRAAARGRATPPPATTGAAGAGQDTEGERQVRLTAQRILTDHLRDHRTPEQRKAEPANARFWPNMYIDLTGATLIDPNFTSCHLTRADFRGATFTGNAWFKGATFIGDAGFDRATFTRYATFDRAAFTGSAWFHETTFTEGAAFNQATFTRGATFRGATFTRGASFDQATFTRGASFDQATFTRAVNFGGATFTRYAWFHETTFTKGAAFNQATFTRGTSFGGATFTERADFDRATFVGSVRFRETAFAKGIRFGTAIVVDSDAHHVWPAGWVVVVQPDGTGRLEQVSKGTTANGAPGG